MKYNGKTYQSQTSAVNKYIKDNYKRISVTILKEDGDKIKALAKSEGKAVNSLVIEAINEYARNRNIPEPLTLLGKPITDRSTDKADE